MRPKGLHDLSVDSSCAFDEVRSISDEATVLMSMYMPQADPRYDLQFFSNLQVIVFINTLSEVFVVLTINVIECQDSSDSLHVMFQSLAQSIVHVHMSEIA